MKKNIILFAAISLVGAAAISCSKESAEPVKANPGMTLCYIEADNGAGRLDTTKTHISGIDGTSAIIAWDEGNDISVFATNVAGAGKNKFAISSISGNEAKFSGEVEDGATDLVAVYPYSEGLSYSGGVISGASIPTIQSATAGSFVNGASIALAKGTKTVGNPTVGDLTFNNLCAVIGFTLPTNITFADQVVITAKSGANIAGGVSINAETSAITSADAASVTVNGTFAGGNTYYICIAPGTYTDGFNFAISTKGGNSYTRSTSKTLPAEAGRLYVLGKLSLALPDDSFSPSVSVSHNISGGTLNGSTATFSMTSNVPDEFDSAIESVITTVSISKGSKTYRTCTVNGKNVGETEMTISAGCPYVPSGCSYTATINYTLNNGEKLVARSIIKTGTVGWSAPSGMVIDATPAGYTSYSCYTGADGQTKSTSSANAIGGSMIKNIGASYKSGLSSDVKTQSDSEGLLTFTSTLDGNDKTGDQDGQSWGTHTIGSRWTFDNAKVSGSCGTTKTVTVTGLPYSYSFPANTSSIDAAGWKRNGSTGTRGDGFLTYQKSAIGYSSYNGYVNSPKFIVPSDIKTTCTIQHRYYSSSGLTTSTKMTVYINAVSSNTVKATSPNSFERSATANTTTGSSDCQTNSGISVTLTSSNCYYCLANNAKSTGSWCSYFVYGFSAAYSD